MARRRGRKRKMGTVREASGRPLRPSPTQRAREAKAVAESARVRVLGVRKAYADGQEAGHAIGRAYLEGNLTAAQKDAAQKFEEAHRNYSRAIRAAPVLPGHDLAPMGGYDADEGTDPAYVDWCAAARRRYAEIRREVLTADPLAMFALEAWILEDKAIHSLIGELRCGLNAIVRLFAVDRRNNAA